MTREQTIGMAFLMLVTSGISVFVEPYVVWAAWKARRETRTLLAMRPERIVADGEFIRALLMLWIGIAGVLMGVIVGLALLFGAFRLDGLAGWVLAIVLLQFTIVPMLSGIRALYFQRKLDRGFASLQAPCADTIFEACPLMPPERLAQLKSMSQSVAESAADTKALADEMTEQVDAIEDL